MPALKSQEREAAAAVAQRLGGDGDRAAVPPLRALARGAGGGQGHDPPAPLARRGPGRRPQRDRIHDLVTPQEPQLHVRAVSQGSLR